MRKEIIRFSTIGLAFILLLCLLLRPVYKMDIEFINKNFDDEIIEITNKEPSAFFDHTFKEESFKTINGHSDLEKMSWKINLGGNDYSNSDNGLVVKHNFSLVQEDFPDFVTIAIFMGGKNARATIKINEQVIGSVELTEEVKRYDFTKDAGTSSVLEIKFETTEEVVLKRIKINETEPYSKEEAEDIFVRDILMHAGLITTNANWVNIDSYELYEEYIDEEVAKLSSGVPFLSLFKMAIEDISYNLSLFSESSGVPLKDRLSIYIEDRHCPFIGIMFFLTGLGIIGTISFIFIKFILDLMFRKSSNYWIPTLIILGCFALMLNVSTFTTIKFFNGDHNISSLWKILFFEVSKLTPTLILSVLISIIMVGVQFINILLEYLNNKKGNKPTKLIVFSSIAGSFIFLILMGLIFK